MTTLEIIDKIQESVDERTAAWQWCEDLRERIESERAALQAAVNEMRSKADAAMLDTPQEIAAIGIRGSIGCIAHHTGVTPTEVE